MKIAVGNDHRGLKTKIEVLMLLSDHEVTDVGTNNDESCDYPDFAAAAARLVHFGKVERAILICGTGMGMAITANKIPGVYACVCDSEFEAERARCHNNANVMCIPSQLNPIIIEKMLHYFINLKFEGGRHERRLNKIKEIENEFS